MITAVCLNPSLDKTAYVDLLLPGEVNRLGNMRTDLGGKGLNVAICAKRMGMEAQVIGFMGQENAKQLSMLVDRENIEAHFIMVEGSVRINLKLISRSDGKVTEFNEPGLFISQTHWRTFCEMAAGKLNQSDFLVLTGSLPPGLGENAYRHLMDLSNRTNTIIDAFGDGLLMTLANKPFWVKPNLFELSQTLAKPLNGLTEIREAANMLIHMGAQNVVVSMGRRGAIYTNGQYALYADSPEVSVCSTVGAGDAMTAGILLGLQHGGTMAQALRYGVAAGAASVMTDGTQPMHHEDFSILLPKVKLQDV